MASKLLGVCSLLMAAIFASSAAVQFHDPRPADWWLWLPLCSFACLVNLADPTSSEKSRKTTGKMVFCLGLVLFFKGYGSGCGCDCDCGCGYGWGGTLLYRQEIAGFWSLDMKDRVAREKFGSGLASGTELAWDQGAVTALNFS